MTERKPFYKSLTLQSFLLLLIASAPDVSDPIWQSLASVGIPEPWIVAAKAVAYVLGAVGVIWGRTRASTKLGMK